MSRRDYDEGLRTPAGRCKSASLTLHVVAGDDFTAAFSTLIIACVVLQILSTVQDIL